MKDIRIGNDVSVVWSLYHDQEPFTLEGLNVALYLKGMYGETKIEDFTIRENQLLWTFLGKEQKGLGKYSLTLVINEGKTGMVTTDTCDFIRLVSCTCNAGGADDAGVHTETIALQSELELAGEFTRIDNALNAESENAVSNAVITAEFGKVKGVTDGLQAQVQQVGNVAGNADAKATQNAKALEGKQDVINDLDTIRAGASKGATALQEVPDGYATEAWVGEQGFLTEHQDITGKQDVINDLDTIRAGASKGATALQEVPDGYATEAWVGEQGFLIEHQDLSEYAKKEEIPTLEGYATESWVSAEIAKAQLEGEGVDPSGFATKDDIKGLATKEETEAVKTWVNEQGFLTEHQSLEGLATEQFVTDRISEIEIPSVDGFATEAWVNEQGFLTEHQDITGKQDVIEDLESIREGATLGATALQRIDYPQLENNLIDSGFYHSQDGMLYRSDMEDAVLESLDKADSALQSENDPIFSASPAASITTERMQEWDNKAGKVVNHASSDTNVELTPYVTHKWGIIASLTLTFSESTESEYNVVFEASDADFVLSIPQNIRWANSQIPQFEAQKQYEINIKGERALYAVFDAPYIEET